mmetsp:Transcript_2612/g.4788  ORF Transcript_2612/g.4788 Transcript_2612/m.4788 type:complete len:123 (+) Transcript_2612:891-1259(+)
MGLSAVLNAWLGCTPAGEARNSYFVTYCTIRSSFFVPFQASCWHSPRDFPVLHSLLEIGSIKGNTNLVYWIGWNHPGRNDDFICYYNSRHDVYLSVAHSTCVTQKTTRFEDYVCINMTFVIQ